MAEGFKDYVWECLREAPSAFRRGVIAVTILANLILALGLYLGWHLNAFTTLQISTAAVCIAALEIVLILPCRLWKSNKAEIAANKAEIAALKTPSEPFPDWKIRELFYHIRPDDILDNTNWQKVGADVLDRLSTGQIKAWGRLTGGVFRHPLQEIATSFWNNARFTYTFLMDDSNSDGDDASHAYHTDLLGKVISYSDIRFNKANVTRVWTK
jgi:hypothetical protein